MGTTLRPADVVWTPEELEFLAEDELISIVPYFSLSTHDSTLNCIAGDFGPFSPNIPVSVPLWMAVMLWESKRCRIEPPGWMKVDELQESLEAERTTNSVFQPLPYHCFAIAYVLFTYVKEAFGNDFYKVKDLVEQIRRVRINKINAGLEQVNGPMVVKLNNVGAQECSIIRPFFQGNLDRFLKISKMDMHTQPSLTPSQPSHQQTAPRQLRRPR